MLVMVEATETLGVHMATRTIAQGARPQATMVHSIPYKWRSSSTQPWKNSSLTSTTYRTTIGEKVFSMPAMPTLRICGALISNPLRMMVGIAQAAGSQKIMNGSRTPARKVQVGIKAKDVTSIMSTPSIKWTPRKMTPVLQAAMNASASTASRMVIGLVGSTNG